MAFDTVKKLRELCIAHAKELLRGSKILLKDSSEFGI